MKIKGFRGYCCVIRSALIISSLLLPLASAWAQLPGHYTISTVSGTTGVLSGPFGLASDSSGNLYITDQFNQVVRKLSGGSLTTVAGNGTAGFSGDGSAAGSAELHDPSGVAVDSSGNIYIGDSGNHVVREVAGGNIKTVAGNQTIGYSGDGGKATNAQLENPSGVAVDSSGNIYFSDSMNNAVRIVCMNQTPMPCAAISSFTAGDITTFAGHQDPNGGGFGGDGGPATQASLFNPIGLAFDQHGNLYVADTGNEVIRKVTSAGIISTVAGSGIAGYSGDGGPALQAALNSPTGLTIDSLGNIFIADRLNSVIRVVELNGNIGTVAGMESSPPGNSGDGGPATSARLYFPSDVVYSGGKIYIADNGNNVIRLLTPIPSSPQINAGGVISASEYGASSTIAPGDWIEIYGTNLAGNTRSWQQSDFKGSSAPTSLDLTSVTIGGQAAYVYYISPNQVDVQVPSSVGPGTQPVIVTTELGTSNTVNVNVAATSPGLLAPASFKIGGTQYAVAFLANTMTIILPTGAIAGLTTQPALPGQTITLYGVGFGAVMPNIPAGQIVGGVNTLSSPVQISIGGMPADVTYQGLAPGLIGTYQFNVVIPTIPANNAAPLTFTQGGVSGTQTLFVAVGS